MLAFEQNRLENCTCLSYNTYLVARNKRCIPSSYPRQILVSEISIICCSFPHKTEQCWKLRLTWKITPPYAKIFKWAYVLNNEDVYAFHDKKIGRVLTLLHSERPKLYTILAFLSAIRLKNLMDFFDWMDDMQFYNNIIDNLRLYALELPLWLRRFRLEQGSKSVH